MKYYIMILKLWAKQDKKQLHERVWKILIGNRKYKNSETLKRDTKRYDIIAEVNNIIGIAIGIAMNGIGSILAWNSL